MAIRVLLVEDTPSVRNELRSLLSRQEGIDLVGEAKDGRSALELAGFLPVDVVVMDILLPHFCGVAAVRRLLEEAPNARVILVSFQSDIRYVKENLRAGASGYVLKDCVYEELVEAVHMVAAGEQFVSPEIEIGIP